MSASTHVTLHLTHSQSDTGWTTGVLYMKAVCGTGRRNQLERKCFLFLIFFCWFLFILGNVETFSVTFLPTDRTLQVVKVKKIKTYVGTEQMDHWEKNVLNHEARIMNNIMLI